MWKLLIVIVVLGTAWSRTLDDTGEDISTRPRPHGREVSQSTNERDLIQCADCKEKMQTDGKTLQGEEIRAASKMNGREKLEKDMSKRRKGRYRRNRHKGKRERIMKKARKPFISIGGVKIRINDRQTKSGQNRTNQRHKSYTSRNDQHITGYPKQGFTEKSIVDNKPVSMDNKTLASYRIKSSEVTKEKEISNKKSHNEKQIIEKIQADRSVDRTNIEDEDLSKRNANQATIQKKDTVGDSGVLVGIVHGDNMKRPSTTAVTKSNDGINTISNSDKSKSKKIKHSKAKTKSISMSVESTKIRNLKISDDKHSKINPATSVKLNNESEGHADSEHSITNSNKRNNRVSKQDDNGDGIKSAIDLENITTTQPETRRDGTVLPGRSKNFMKMEANENIAQGSSDKEKDDTHDNSHDHGKIYSNKDPLEKNTKKSRRKSRRQRKGKHTKKKELKLNPVAVNDDRWLRPNLVQVPDVKRLERRLHPTVEAPVSDIITSFRKILHQMQHSIYLIDFDYKHTFNVTRWSIMTGVREELMNIAKENDNVYDAVMDASLHTKELYMRAHQRKRFGDIQALTMAPIRDRNGPRNIDLRSKYQYARDEMRSAQILKRKIRELQRQRSTLRYDYIELTRKISEKLPTRALYDLSRRVNQTIETLHYSRAMRDAMNRGHRNRHSKESSYRDMRIARNLIQDAKEVIEVVNQQYSNNHLKAKEIKNARVSRHRNTSTDFDMLHMEWWASADRAKLYANKLFNTAAMILMKFQPLLKQADLVIAKLKNGTLETKFERDVRNIREKLQRLNSEMFDIKTDVCTDRYEVCIPKVEELDTEEIDKVEASGIGSDDTEDEGEDVKKTDTDQTTTALPTKSEDKVTDSAGVTTDKNYSSTTNDRNGTTDESSGPRKSDETDIDLDTETEDDSEEIYFSSGDELTEESSGDGFELSTDDTTDMNITKIESNDTLNSKTPIEPTQKTVVTLSNTDDEDLYEDLKHTKKTSLSTIKTTQTTTTEAPEKTPPPVEEEKEEEEGGWWWLDDPFGLIQDQMFGGSNNRRKRDTSNAGVELSNITLNERPVGVGGRGQRSINYTAELIQQHLKNRSGVNKDLLKRAQTRLQSLEELKKNLSVVQNKLSRFENNTMQIRGFTHKWKAKSAEFRTVHEQVVDISKDVKFKEEVFGEQIDKAVKKAESKLKRMQEVYENNKDRVTDTSGPDNALEALELANTVKNNIAEIVNIKNLNPAPCKKLEMMDNSMRANISILRQKIRQAKLIAASLKVAVNLDGTSHLTLPVSTPDQNKQSQLHLEMIVKSNSDNGAIAVIHANNTGAISISLKDYLPTVTLYDDGKYKIEEQEGNSPLYNDTWYRFILNRFGTVYNLTIYNRSSVVQSFLTEVDANDYPTVYSSPSSVFVGGAHEDYYLDKLNGCVGDIRLNDQFLNVLQADSKSVVPSSCTLLSKTLVPENSLILESNSHTFYKLNNRQLRSRVRQFAINFTVQSDGALFTIKAENNRFQAYAFVKERKLDLTLKHHSFSAHLISVDDIIGIAQRLEILSNGRSLDVYLNNRKEGFVEAETAEEFLTSGRANIGIYIGTVSNISSIRGCIQGIKLNDENIPLNSMFDGEQVIYGTCQSKDCMLFSNKSKSIQLSNITTASSLSIVFSYGSLGNILQYSKGKKFNLNILIDDDGLQMKETVKDNTETIKLPDSEFTQCDDVVVIVMDGEDEVTVLVGEESQTFSYGSNGGGGFFGFFGIGNGDNDDDDDDTDDSISYNITIGGNENKAAGFEGSLVALRIQNRPLDLTSYAKTHNLQRCSLSQSAPLMTTPVKKRKALTC